MNSDAAMYAALAAAQGELKNPPMNGTNPAFKRGNSSSRYATLMDVREQVVPVFAKHGLSVVQEPKVVPGEKIFAGVTTKVCHKDGGCMASELLVPISKPDAHGVGAAITYARRFSLMAIAGVVGDEDDDGNAASGVDAPAAQRAVAPSMSADECKALLAKWTGIKEPKELQAAGVKCFSLAGVQLKPQTPPTVAQWSQLGAWINTQVKDGKDFIALAGGSK